jgi:Fe-coproporphyrin III synthase
VQTTKLLGLGATALKSNFTRLQLPYKLNFAITMKCQSRCLHCNIWQLKPSGELTIDEIREFARKNGSFKWVELTGGEPFLRSDIVDIAAAFKEGSKELYVLTTPTNSLCSNDLVIGRLTEILKLGIPRVVITLSLDGYREVHDRVRGIPGNFDKVMTLARRFMELKKEYPGFTFVFGYTINRFNEGQLIKTVETVLKEIPGITANDFHLNLAQNSSNYYHNENSQIKAASSDTVAEIEQFVKMRKPQLEPMQLVEGAFLKNLLIFAKTGKQPMRSRSLEASLFLDSWGNIYPSIMWDRKIANARDIGFDLNNVWRGKEAEDVRNAIKRGEEPVQWTSCEAYQSIVGNVGSLF